MIGLVNVWEEKRYERMKKIGHNLIFSKWMLSVESGSAIKKQLQNIFADSVTFLFMPIYILLNVLYMIYMLIPKIFIKKQKRHD